MDTIIEIIATLALVAVDVFIAVLFSEMIGLILEKKRAWICLLVIILGIFMLQTSVYSWLPGRLGYAIELFDGAITLQDGAVLSNLGAILITWALAVGILLAKYIWSVIRKKERFSGKYFALETLFMAAFGTAGILLFENEDAIAFSRDPAVQPILLISLFSGGLLLTAAGIRAVMKTMKRHS